MYDRGYRLWCHRRFDPRVVLRTARVARLKKMVQTRIDLDLKRRVPLYKCAQRGGVFGGIDLNIFRPKKRENRAGEHLKYGARIVADGVMSPRGGEHIHEIAAHLPG